MVEKNNATSAEETLSSSVSLTTFFAIKAGMTRIFDQDGNHVPVTVVRLIPNYISQVRTKEKEGYDAYQVAFYEKREKLVNAPTKGHLDKAKIKARMCRFSEVKTESVDVSKLGSVVTLDVFTAQTFIDVTGVSKGKGYQGVVKKFGFRGGSATHGSKTHRATGAIGNRATPARVFKNKKMPGHMGVEKVTVQNIKIVEVNLEKGYMLLKGSIPGSKNGFIRIAKAVKK